MRKFTLIIAFLNVIFLLNSTAQNNALHFDGVNDKVTTSLVLSKTTYPTVTMECKFKPERLNYSTDYQGIIGNDAGGFNSRQVWIQSGTNKLCVAISGGQWVINHALTENEWHHVAVVYTPDNIKAYVDGTLYTNTTDDNNTSTAVLAIGVGYLQGQPFKGAIDEVRIWDRERTAQEIQDNIDTEIGLSEAGLIAYYSCNQGTANGDNTSISSLTDSKGSNNGTLVNFQMNGSTSNFIPSGTLSVDDMLNDNSISVYPNPAGNWIYFQGLDSAEKIKIYDLNGQLIYDTQVANNQINVSTLTPGFYFMKLETSKGIAIKKIVKQ